MQVRSCSTKKKHEFDRGGSTQHLQPTALYILSLSLLPPSSGQMLGECRKYTHARTHARTHAPQRLLIRLDGRRVNHLCRADADASYAHAGITAESPLHVRESGITLPMKCGMAALATAAHKRFTNAKSR